MTSYIDKITLECLTNYKQRVMKLDTSALDKKEMKFYRKRILGLVRDLLYNEDATYTSMETDFINHYIDHFKMQDQADLFQKEFADLDLTPSVNKEVKEYVSQDNLLMRSKKVNMDSFVTRSGIQNPIMPQRREVDLTNPELRTKGLPIKTPIISDEVLTQEVPIKEKEKEIVPVIYAEDEKKNKNKKKKTKLFVEI